MRREQPDPQSGNASAPSARPVRADARRNLDSLLAAALSVFNSAGVDAPVREIAEKAGLGVGTVYRHFPQRSDLVAAVFRHEIDACAEAATALTAGNDAAQALTLWMQRYAAFIATKRGLAAALHSGDPAFETLPAYFADQLRPALAKLLDRAAAEGEVRSDVDAADILRAVGNLCMSEDKDAPGQTKRMVALLVDGLRFGAMRQSGVGQ